MCEWAWGPRPSGHRHELVDELVTETEVVVGDPERGEHRVAAEESFEGRAGPAHFDGVAVKLVWQGCQHPGRERFRCCRSFRESLRRVHREEVSAAGGGGPSQGKENVRSTAGRFSLSLRTGEVRGSAGAPPRTLTGAGPR